MKLLLVQTSPFCYLTLLLCPIRLSAEVGAHLSARPDQRNLDSQGTFFQRRPQAGALCRSQLGPSHPSGLLLFSPLPGPPPQSYLSAPAGASLLSPVLPLSPRASSYPSACWSAPETSRGAAQRALQADLSSVQQTVQHQAAALQ